MHEYNLKDYPFMAKSTNSNTTHDDGDQVVLSQIRKNDQTIQKKERKRKFDYATEFMTMMLMILQGNLKQRFKEARK